MNSTTEGLLEEWELFGRAAGWCDQTVTLRRNALLRLMSMSGVPLEDITPLDLARWLAGYSTSATKATYFRHVRSFYAWLTLAGYRADDPTKQLKRPRDPAGLPRPLTDAELEAVLSDASPDVRAWLCLAAYAGLRLHEIAKVRGQDVDLVAGSLRVAGKGGTQASLPLHPELAELAEAYPRTGYWFPPRKKSGSPHVSRGLIGQLVLAQFRRHGVAGGIHRARHWYGTNVLRSSGGNLRVAQELLRHSSPATTAIYTQLDDGERTAAILALSIRPMRSA